MIAIKPSILKKAKRTAQNAGYSTVEEYVEDLIVRDADESPPNSFSTKEELLALIDEGLNSPTVEMTEDQWQSFCKQILRKS